MIWGGLTESNALADANEDSAGDEAAQVAFGSKGLHERRDDGHEAASHHPNLSPEIIALGECVPFSMPWVIGAGKGSGGLRERGGGGKHEQWGQQRRSR